MKTIKSVLICALVALLGSSAWAKDPSEPIVETKEVGFAREQFFDPVLALRPNTEEGETPASPNAQWEVWSNDPDLVTVAVTEPGVEVKREDAKDQGTYEGQSAQATMWASLENSGTTWVYLQNKTDHKCYAFKVVCDVVNCVSVALKQSKTLEDKSGESWYEINPDWINPDDIESDGYAFSSDEDIAEIKEEDGKFYLHATGRKDGQTKVTFIKSRDVMLDAGRKDKKIWMFYVTASTVEVEKFLSFPEGVDSNKVAMLNIRAHYLEGVVDITNRVLFVGTGCSAHYSDLKTSIVRSLDTICDKAEVEAYILTNGQEANDPQSVHTIFPKGYPVTASSLVRYGSDGRGLHPGASGTTAWNPINSSGHACLREFYHLLYSIANTPETRYKYDYIVLEFDGTRLASPKGTSWATDVPREQELVVSEWLNEYYEGRKDSPGSRVIWIVDDDDTVHSPAPQSIHEQERTRGEDGKDAYFRPFNAYNSDGTSSFNEINTSFFRGLLGLLNPWICIENKLFDLSGTELTAKLDEVLGSKVPFTCWSTTPIDCYVGQTYAHTAYYDDPDELVKFLAERIVPTAYAATITDNVETQGLAIVDGPYIYGSYAKEAADGYEPDPTGKDSGIWTELGDSPSADMSASGTVWKAGNSITGITENITREFWNLVQLKIEDKDGSFRANADLIGDRYYRDPNLNTNIVDGTKYVDVTNGEAAVASFYDINRPDLAIDDDATTLWDWEFDCLPITLKSEGVNRPYDGTSTNATYTVDPSEDEGTEIKVAYSTDKTNWTGLEDYGPDKFTDCTNVWVRFVATKDGYLSATSEAQVVIRPLPVTVTLVGSTNKYDALGHTVTVNVNPKQDIGDSSRKTELSFSTDNSTWSDWVAENKAVPPAFTNCGTYTVYAKVRNLPNYTNDAVVSADVVITQRVITVTATAAKKTYGDGDPTFAWTWSGDYVLKEKSWIESQLGSKTEGITRISAGAGSQERAGLYANALSSNVAFSAGQNYIVNFVPGDFTIEPGQLKLTAKAYSGVYDGEGHTIDLQINVTNDATSRICIRTSTDGTNWSEWTPWPAGDVKDILPMATNVADSMTVHVQATNQWLLTFGATPAPTYTRDSIGNYKSTSTSAKVTITKRPVTLTALADYKNRTKECAYDEVPLTFVGSEIIDTTAGQTDKGYVTGETFTYSNFSSNSTPGKTKDATFSYADGSALIGNYTTTVVKGYLKVGKAPSPHNPCHEEDPDPVDVARVYQVQFNTYTTKGKVIGGDTISGGQCGEDTTLGCTILRGRDKTVIRGYVFICADSCELKDYDCAFCDVTRRGVGTVGKTFQVNFCNAIGANLDQAEISWDFEDTFTYDTRSQKYELTGSGYGKVKAGATLFFDNFAGYFAGTAEGSYDFTTPKTTGVAECVCERSKVVTCEKYDSDWRAVLEDSDTVAFGAWKMKFNSNASIAMLTHDPTTYFLGLLKKMFK